MVNELLTECTALVCIFDRFFIAHPRKTDALDDDTNALVIEVGHDHCWFIVSLPI